MDFHTLKAEQVLKKLKTGEKGLKEKDAEHRLKKHGPNRLPQEKPLSRLKIFLWQFKSPLIYILVIAGAVTLFLQEFTDSIVIFAAVALNTIVGYIQESKANRALRVLRKVLKNKVVVIRDGQEKEIEQEKVVIGDIIILKQGDKVPADARVIESHDLRVNESALTGEWLAVEKKIESLEKETFFADRTNMVYMGTVVEYGFGKAVITATGHKTEFGRVAKLIKETKEEATPYQQKLAKFSKIIGIVIVAICALIFIEGMLTGGEFIEMFVTAIAVAVAAIPEGLPLGMTVILAIGMQKILGRKGLVRRLASAETLGSTSIICTDKTGTLTEGKMEVVDIISAEEKYDSTLPHKDGSSKPHDTIYKTITLLSEAFIENPKDKMHKWILRGRPTDKALLMAGYKAGFHKDKLKKEYKEIDRILFNSANKFSAGLFSARGGSALGGKVEKSKHELLFMGAPEVVIEKCKLNKDKVKELNNKVAQMTGQGLRVLAVAYKPAHVKHDEEEKLQTDDIKEMVFIGFVALKDPLRPQAKNTIRLCKQAGLHPIIITGDHKLTAKAIAKEIGLGVEDKNIVEGKEVEKMTDKQLKKRIRDITVYARVKPEQKLRIVNIWQSLGEVVAMTGDGINDAPALKKADVGVALGSGTIVAKEVSDLVLLPDDFRIIVAAIEEGRSIIDNIRKVITYLLASGFTEVILISVAIIFGFPLPVLAVQILWVNLIEDGLPNLALAFEPKEKDIMKRKPIPKGEPLLTNEMKFIIFVIGILTDIALLGIFYYLYTYSTYSLAHIRSVIFVALAIDSIFFVYSCKSLRQNIWHIPLFSNKLLLISSLVSIAALVLALYMPVLQTLLRTVPLNLIDWGLLITLGLANVALIEVGKWMFIRKRKVV